jgi:hypothetical protein
MYVSIKTSPKKIVEQCMQLLVPNAATSSSLVMDYHLHFTNITPKKKENTQLIDVCLFNTLATRDLMAPKNQSHERF